MVLAGQIKGRHQQSHISRQRFAVGAQHVVADLRYSYGADQQCVEVVLFVDDRLADLYRVVDGLDEIRGRVGVGVGNYCRHRDVIAQRGQARIQFGQKGIQVAEGLTNFLAPTADRLRQGTKRLVELRGVDLVEYRCQSLE